MLRVQVRIVEDKQNQSFDLEVPAEVPVVELDWLVSCALKWDVDPNGQMQRHMVRALPPNRVIHSQESLAEAQVWDGATLMLSAILAAYVTTPSGRQLPLLHNPVIIGRRTTDDQLHPDELLDISSEPKGGTVSRRHALLSYAIGQWQLAHISLTNQTRVNDHLLESDVRMALRPGDHIQLGGVEIQFCLGHPPFAAAQLAPRTK